MDIKNAILNQPIVETYRDVEVKTLEEAAKRYKECLAAGHTAFSKDYPPPPGPPDIAGYICKHCKIYVWVNVRKMIQKV